MQKEFKKTQADLKVSYGLNIRKAFLVTLILFNAVVLLSPRLDVQIEEELQPNIQIDVEEIPATRQVRRNPPPPKPKVPVPSSDETIPEDVTIEETTLKYTNIFDDIPEGVPEFSGVSYTPPRPLAWVFPEYPEEEKKKGVQGVVKLSIHIDEKGRVIEAIVVDNTTGSNKCAQAAIEAAHGSRFTPAKEGKKPVSSWITQPYRFNLKK
ncbi:energy transducer TonB [candidate division KSB1 bacterium]|nr:energy transducer TonB [candidate division KSB1 bacterium]NIR71476.1 energy transducer TonB [candidate division KSB1 bacterium]NIS23397.1 energy transducer TonB [candidate division KSB1 bacterium]NIT70288.1 energy transducer TonB [candidate division KSB1 bacterium]NIU24011.1 energy transducer TonB [candidate division KSB1 bacterium]